jgi:hypothetical protein
VAPVFTTVMQRHNWAIIDSARMGPDIRTSPHLHRGSCWQAMSSPLTPTFTTLAKSGQKQAIDQVNFACDSRVECENRVP